jgi:hypothetical protein
VKQPDVLSRSKFANEREEILRIDCHWNAGIQLKCSDFGFVGASYEVSPMAVSLEEQMIGVNGAGYGRLYTPWVGMPEVEVRGRTIKILKI